MIYHKLLLSITVIAFFLVQADAKPSMLMNAESLGFAGDSGDPLDPSQLGESMSMPLPQELIQEAEKTGVITESNPLDKSDSKQPGFSAVPQPEADADNSLDNVNVTGAWSFDLKGKAPEQMKLYLIQNEDVVMGQGVINRGNGTEKATVSGSISGEKMSLTVMPVGVSNLYKFNLSLSSLAAGTYTADMADGSSQSGKVTFAVSSNIFKPSSTVAEDGLGAYATADSAAATPAQEKTADDWYKKGREQLGKTPLEDVIKSYDRALEINPNNATYWAAKGSILSFLALTTNNNQSKYNESLESYNKSLQLDPENPWAWDQMGTTLLQMKRYNESLEARDRAIEFIDKYQGKLSVTKTEMLSSIWAGKAYTLQEAGRMEESLAAFDKALQINPGNYDAYMMKCRALKALGQG